MNKTISNPLIIQFTRAEEIPAMKRSKKSVFVPVNTPWNAFKNCISLMEDPAYGYDSVLVHIKDDVDRDAPGAVSAMTVKLNALAGAASRKDKPVLTYEAADKPFYLVNAGYDDRRKASAYAPSDETILGKYKSYGSDDAWQEHQDKIWGRMKDMMPLSKTADQYSRNHAAQLKDPKRGLEDADLGKFWSFKPGQSLSPGVMGDDMVGMPSVEGKRYDGFVMAVRQGDGSVKKQPMEVRSLTTAGMAGIMIPMANANGHVNKHQVATDLTPFGAVLHFRAADGRTVAKGELFDKKTREYSFSFADGTPSHLKVTGIASDNTATLEDVHGTFTLKPKTEALDVLKGRGYQVPPIIASAKLEQTGKYMWQSPGTMTGSDEVLKTVSPSNPGFIVAREPKNGSKEYVDLVVEGALKGCIVAKYVDVKDKNGKCFGDTIAGDKGIIVTQVPGVAEAYVKNALPIYDKYPIVGTYIAMDADGRENRNVARGIHSAYQYISKRNPTTVLSWDPAQKGMDDALLAVAQGKITIGDMKLVSGTPEQMFPIDKAHAMTPYRLDGTRTKTPSWVQEYEEEKNARKEKVAAAQKETAQWEEKKDVWVETPKDLENLKNLAVAKASDMEAARNGVLPVQKPEMPLKPTPDVDEQLEYQAAEKPAPAAEKRQEIPSMKPLPVPDGYKARYRYEQDVSLSFFTKRPDLPGSHYELKGQAGDMEQGTFIIETDRELEKADRETYRQKLSDGQVACVGSMRLTSQTFTLDREMNLDFDLPDTDQKKDGGLAL